MLRTLWTDRSYICPSCYRKALFPGSANQHKQRPALAALGYYIHSTGICQPESHASAVLFGSFRHLSAGRTCFFRDRHGVCRGLQSLQRYLISISVSPSGRAVSPARLLSLASSMVFMSDGAIWPPPTLSSVPAMILTIL